MALLHPTFLWLALLSLLAIYIPRKEITADMSPKQRVLNHWTMFAGVIAAFFFFGLAGPQFVDKSYTDVMRPAEVVGLLDNSGSTSVRIPKTEKDMTYPGAINEPERVEISGALRKNFIEFAKARPQDKIGLMVFDDDAEVLLNRELDNGAKIEAALRNYKEPNNGTSIVKSLNKALDQFTDAPKDHDRILLIGTDGSFFDDLQGDASDALMKRIQDLNVIVYMVIASEPIDRQNIAGALDFVAATDGEDNVLVARNADELAKAFRMVSKFEPPVWEVLESRHSTDVSWMFFGGAGVMILIVLGAFVFGNRKPGQKKD
jgi:von Willebrand factor type A domain.